MADPIQVVMKTRTVRIKINPYVERSEIMKCLALSGRKVWQEKTDKNIYDGTDDSYYVCFEVDESEIE